MTAERWEELVGRLLDGALSPEEHLELLGEVESRPDRRRQYEELLSLEPFLADLLRGDREGRGFVGLVEHGLRKGSDTAFLRRVVSKAQRRARWAPRRPAGSGGWRLGLAAAAALVTIVLAATLSSRPAAPSKGSPAAADAGPAAPPSVRERAREEREEAEARLAESERRLRQARQKADEAREDDLRRKAEEAFLAIAAERRAIEERLRVARERETAAAREAPAPPKAAEEPPPRAVTGAAAATLEGVAGEVHVLDPAGRRAAREGDALRVSQGLETAGPGSAAVLVFPDRTRVEVAAGTVLTGVTLAPGTTIGIRAGSVSARVSRQPAGRPFVFASPHGEAVVLGTTLRISVDPDPGTGMRLDVVEGKVRLKNLAGRTADVPGGHFAVAAAGTELRVESLLPDSLALELLRTKGALGINFGPEGSASPDGFLGDFGGLFDPKRGFGWQEPIVQVHQQLDMGRPLMTRNPKQAVPVKDLLKDTWIGAGWKDITQTWRMPVPNGKYLVSVVVGDPGWPQGPHHVWVEGAQVLDAVVTRAGEYVERSARVDVRDLELTLRVGGSGKDFDSTSDTMLCYLIVRKVER